MFWYVLGSPERPGLRSGLTGSADREAGGHVAAWLDAATLSAELPLVHGLWWWWGGVNGPNLILTN